MSLFYFCDDLSESTIKHVKKMDSRFSSFVPITCIHVAQESKILQPGRLNSIISDYTMTLRVCLHLFGQLQDPFAT